MGGPCSSGRELCAPTPPKRSGRTSRRQRRQDGTSWGCDRPARPPASPPGSSSSWPGVAARRAPAWSPPPPLRRAARPGDYVAILAYLPPRPEVAAGLQEVRGAWARATDCATTLGFGPRYLHSTGQLHKGGPNTGLFLVITAEDAEDAEVPEMGITFGRLKRAQARGDVRALLARGRRVAHVHLTRPEDVSALATL